MIAGQRTPTATAGETGTHGYGSVKWTIFGHEIVTIVIFRF